ncbi:MAG: hypothetical protein ACR2HN_05120 [Tepidiformaceae bacterium]
MYILGNAEADGLLGVGVPFRRVAFEVQCVPSACAEMTTALYMRADQAASAATLGEGLREAIGLAESLRSWKRPTYPTYPETAN